MTRFATCCFRLLGAALVWMGCVSICTAELSSIDITTMRLLDALEERQMPDMAMIVLDRVEANKAAGEELRKQVPFRRAKAIVALSRVESDSAKRAASYDRAEKELDAFLKSNPASADAIAAYMQKGNLLVERGRVLVEQSKRPGADQKKLLADALPFFDAAIKTLEGKAKPGEEITDVTNAEDAVVKSLREVDGELKKLGGEDATKDDAGKKTAKTAKKPAKGSRADAARAEELEERRDALRAQLLQVRLLVAGVYFEKSRALPPKSKEWEAALTKSAQEYNALYTKYGKLGAGMFARYYEGRNYAELGKFKEAIGTLAELCILEGEAGFVPGLRAKAINTSLQCWLADDKETRFADFSADMLKAALAQVSGDQLDADWLGMKYRAATVLQKRAANLPANEKNKGGVMLRDARKLALDVAKANRDFSKEARDLLALLGKDVSGDAAGMASFESTMDDAKVTLAAMQAKQAEAKQAQAANKADEVAAALAAAEESRNKTIAAVTKALALAGDEDEVAAVNQARYLLTFLLYDAKRLHESATLGEFLAARYPNSKGSRQAATIAMASWQQLQKQASAEWSQDAKAKCARVAELVMRTWPDEPESGDAALVAVASAIEARQPEKIVAIIGQVPAGSPRRGEVLLRAGTALYRELQENRRVEEASRPAADVLAAWQTQSLQSLDEGLGAIPAGSAPTKVAVAAALARAQLAMEAGDLATVGTLLESKEYGPWAVIQGSDPQFTEGPLAEGSLSLALRYFIGADKLEQADLAMTKLESLAGQGEEASAKLTGMYLAMGRDLQSQLDALSTGDQAGSPEAQAKADKILGGFEKFLERVGSRDNKISSQMWVASTFLTLGSGEGTGKVVSKDRAAGYLTKAAEVYEKLLAKGGDEISKFEAAIRLKMANIYRERGKWDEALGHLDWILGDAKRQNMLDVQIQAAQLLQTAGEKTADKEQAADFFKQAIAGRKHGASVMWGWGGLSNKLVRQAFAGNDDKSLKTQAQFFDARLNVARCRFARAELPGQDKAKLLEMAFNDIAVTYKLYPGLGGEAMKKRFDKLLRQVQEARGMEAKGLAAIDAAPAAEAAAGG